LRIPCLSVVAGLLMGAAVYAQELPVLKVETVAVPVRTARINAATLAQDAPGRWQFICQAMNYKGTTDFTYERRKVPGTNREYVAFKETDKRPDAEWVVVDLETGRFHVYDLPGFHAGAAVRAENGRVFFFADFMHVWYYEPEDGRMRILGQISEWVPFTNDRSFYQTRLGLDGKVYATTQSYSGKTAVIQIDPDALTWKTFADVGVNRPKGLTYGYYMGLGLPWVYVGVGQDHWELMAVNVETGQKTLLAERTGEGARVIVSDDGKGAVSADLLGGGKKETVWCTDGRTQPAQAGVDAPRAELPQGRKGKPTPEAPQLDPERPVVIEGDGSATIWWRPAGDQGEWRRARFQIRRAEPELIESFTLLPDGSILGSVRQYNGWFRCQTADGKCEYFGKGGPSRSRTCVFNGQVYYAGYPNSHMYVYDPARPWKTGVKPETDAANNPMLIGSFGQGVTEAHYATILLPGPNERIYLVGKRERWSTGTGLGYYDIRSGKRFGLGQDMKDYEAHGAALLPKLNRIVISGKGPDVSGQFRVYDLDLKAQEPVTLKEGLGTTGLIQNIGRDTQLLGWIGGQKVDTLYLFDFEQKAIVKWKEMDKPAETETQQPGQGSWWAEASSMRTQVVFQKPDDGSWWMLHGNKLCCLNTDTLDLEPVASFDRRFDLPLWVGRDIFGVAGGNVVRVTLPRK
jgi:hypothetical protein